MKDQAHIPSYEDMDPTIQLRSDLWNTMGVTDLLAQRELLVNRLLTMGKIINWDTTPGTQDIYLALQHGMDQLNSIIDGKTTKILT